MQSYMHTLPHAHTHTHTHLFLTHTYTHRVLAGVQLVLALGAFVLSGGAWLTVKLVTLVYNTASLMADVFSCIKICG